MSTETSTGDRPHEVSVGECAAWRRRARDGETNREIAADARFARATVGKHVRNHNCCGHDTEGETGEAPLAAACHSVGIPSDLDADERRVARAIAAMLDTNIGGTVGVRPDKLARRYPERLDGCPQRRIGVVLRRIADRGVVCVDGQRIAVACSTPDANRPTWTAKFVGGKR